MCSLGLALSCDKELTENKEVKNNPVEVTIENVYYHDYEAGKPTCLYSSRERNIGSSDNPREGAIALDFDIKIHDEDVIKHLYIGWGEYRGEDRDTPFFSYENKSKNKKTEISNMDNGYPKAYLKQVHFQIKITDWKGNTEEKTFTLDQILKNAKPMNTKPMKLVDGKYECDDKF